MLSAKSGYLADSRSDAYRIMISSNGRIQEEGVTDVLADNYDLPVIVNASLAGTHNVNWRTWCVAKKFGIVGREAVYDRKSARFIYEKYSGTPLTKEALRELFHDKYDLEKIVQKKIAGKKISTEDDHKFNRAWKISSLLENFGKTALVTLSGFGVGADTGARILRNMIGEEELYKQIYEAERQYVTTRGFWD